MHSLRNIAIVFSALTFVAAATTATLAKSHSHPSLAVTMDVPDDWETRAQGDMLAARKGKVGVMLGKLEEKTVKEATEKMKENIGKLMPNAAIGKGKKVKIAGKKGMRYELSGGPDGQKLKGYITLFALAKDTVAMAMGMAPEGEYKASKKAIDTIFASIKTAKPAKK